MKIGYFLTVFFIIIYANLPISCRADSLNFIKSKSEVGLDSVVLISSNSNHTLSAFCKGKLKYEFEEGEQIILINNESECFVGFWYYYSATKIVLKHNNKIDTIDILSQDYNIYDGTGRIANLLGGVVGAGMIYYGVRLDLRNRPDSTILQLVNLKLAGVIIITGGIVIFSTLIRAANYNTYSDYRKATFIIE